MEFSILDFSRVDVSEESVSVIEEVEDCSVFETSLGGSDDLRVIEVGRISFLIISEKDLGEFGGEISCKGDFEASLSLDDRGEFLVK